MFFGWMFLKWLYVNHDDGSETLFFAVMKNWVYSCKVQFLYAHRNESHNSEQDQDVIVTLNVPFYRMEVT